jgi:putative endonuclease
MTGSRIPTHGFGMGWFVRMIYRGLVWKERQRAQRASSSSVELSLTPAHLDIGERGEMLAYWYLRQAGYNIVARNLRARLGSAELDLVGWDGPVLAFVEVKTRSSLDSGPPEAAVSAVKHKQKRIVKAANQYMRQLGRKPVSYRFDIASVTWDPSGGYHIDRLIKDAFKG